MSEHLGSLRLTRRALLAGAGAGLVSACAGDAPNEDVLPPDPRADAPTTGWQGIGAEVRAAFPEGVQTGDPLPDTLLVWTRAAVPGALTLHVATWGGADWQARDPRAVSTDADGYLHVDITDLPPDTAVAVQLVDSNGDASYIAQGHTAISPESTAEVRFGAISCCAQSHGQMPAFEAGRTLGPMDFFLWLGDTVYADGSVTRADYRSFWRNQLGKRTFIEQHGAVPSIYTWDDHEVDNNWDPETINPAQLEAATSAFLETTAIRPNPDHPGRIWRSMRFGQTVELFVLDCRGERLPSQSQYVSPEQLAWLIDRLKASPCTWKVIANSVPITDMPPPWDVRGSRFDRWEGFPEQRDTLLNAILDNALTGVLFVAGDFHQTALARVDPEGPASQLLEVFAGPGGSFLNLAGRLLPEGLDEQFIYSDAEWSATRIVCHHDGTATVTMVREDAELLLDAVIDVHGEVLDLVARHPWLTD